MNKERQLAYRKLIELQCKTLESEYSYDIEDDKDLYNFITIYEFKKVNDINRIIRSLQVRDYESARKVLQAEIDRIERCE